MSLLAEILVLKNGSIGKLFHYTRHIRAGQG
jgi:hypothetical protein